MSKILVLGGAGGEGSTLVRDMVANNMKEVIIADYDLKAAEDLAKSLSGSTTTLKAVFADANDYEQLVSLIKKTDPTVVCNMIGPYYKYAVTVMKAVIEAGYPYTDINDDWEPSKEIFDKIEEFGENINLPMIIGAGSSPGVSNMAAKLGSEQMDKTKKVSVTWLASTMAILNPAVLDHMFNIYTGDCIQHLDGVTQSVPAGGGKHYVESYDGFYRGNAFYVGHGEPVTLPRYIDADEIVCLGGIHPEGSDEVFLGLRDGGLNSREMIEINGKEISRLELASLLLEDTYIDNELAVNYVGYLGVKVDGIQNNEDKSLLYEMRIGEPTGSMTALTCSIVAQMIAKGEITQKGIHAPEVLSKDQIKTVFSELKKRGYDIVQLEV